MSMKYVVRAADPGGKGLLGGKREPTPEIVHETRDEAVHPSLQRELMGKLSPFVEPDFSVTWLWTEDKPPSMAELGVLRDMGIVPEMIL